MGNIRVRVSKRRSLFRRLLRIELFLGVPMVALELVLTPAGLWGITLEYFMPSTFVGLFAATLIEHVVVYLASKVSKGSAVRIERG
jgi:hypothetical protein